MEQKFNVGDRVRCVDYTHTSFDPQETYVVLEADDGYLYFDEPFGGGWLVDRFELVEDTVEAVAISNEDVVEKLFAKPVKSDGGSSEYYKITVPLPDTLYDADGNPVTSVQLETQDLLYAMFYGEWSCSNVGKAARRIAEALQGRGKAGTSIAYDAKKIIWFGEDILKRFGKE